MEIELAYFAEQCAKIMDILEKEFLRPEIAKAEQKQAEKKEKKKRTMAFGATRIMSFSPLLGRNPSLQKGLEMTKELLEAAKKMNDPANKMRVMMYVNVYRAFLQIMGSISESGLGHHLDIARLFISLFRCCIARGQPDGGTEVKVEETKKSWANFLQAMDQVKKKEAPPDCKTVVESLQALKKDLEENISDLHEVERTDAENFVSAVENIVVACESCIFKDETAASQES
jgi:hypothetical protein